MGKDVRAFFEALNEDEALRQRIADAMSSSEGEQTDDALWEVAFAPIVAEGGYDVTLEDMKAAMASVRETLMAGQADGQELTDDELELVAGGFDMWGVVWDGVKDGFSATYERWSKRFEEAEIYVAQQIGG